MERRLAPCVAAVLGVVLITPNLRGQCTLEEDLKLLPGDGAAEDTYGGPLRVDGDVLVVGAPLKDSVNLNAGAAYVHRRVGGVWTEEAKLTSSDPQTYDAFGTAVDVEGDVIVIGAFYDDGVLPDDGAAFVFRHDGNAWQEEQQLTASDPALGARFGRAVDVQGEWIAVGAYHDDDLGTNSGSVYLFQFDGAAWIERQKLLPGDGAAGDLFGVAVSFSGDALLVGSYFDDTTFLNTGSAYVFRYDGNTWIEEQKLTALDAAAEDQIGAAVSLDGDTAVLGSYGDDAAGEEAGSAYVFEFDGGSWVQVQELIASDGSPGDEFGWSVSLAGDVLAVGAYWDGQEGHFAGSAYVYRHDGSAWIEERKLLASDAAAGDWFGTSVSLSGTDLWIGAINNDDFGDDSGAAYLYDVRPLGLNAAPTSVSANETLTLTTAPGAFGNLAALFVVDLGGPPLYQQLVTLSFGGDCQMEVAFQVPAGLAGLEATFQSFGFGLTGKLEKSNVVMVSFL